MAAARAGRERVVSLLWAKPPTNPLVKDPNLHLVFGVTLMAVLGVASIAPALPRIARDLHLQP